MAVPSDARLAISVPTQERARLAASLRGDGLVALGELATITDLVRLIAQQVACPEELAADDTVERQPAELDERDAARQQIANELR